MKGDLARAEQQLARAPFSLRPVASRHARAALLLARGQREEAKPLLSGTARFPLFAKEAVGRQLMRLGRYAEFLDYDRAVAGPETAEVRFYRAAALLSAGDFENASRLAGGIDWSKIDPARAGLLRQAIEARRKGDFPLVRDAAGNVLAIVSGNDLVPLADSVSALIDRAGGEGTIEAQLPRLGTALTIETTIDPRVQRAAAAAIAEYRASLVAIDLRTNRILAVANSRGDGPRDNLAFSPRYEPGSVIKVITLMNAVDSGIDLSGMFPMSCGGYLEFNGRMFYDWAVHGTLPGPDEAMAVSCNVAYGRLGMALGASRLEEMMGAAGFGHSADLGGFVVPLGTTRGEVSTPYDLASYGVGLEHAATSPLHIAMIAAAVANGGMMRDPVLIAARRTVLGDLVNVDRSAGERRVASPKATAAALEAMRAVVANEMGTGRRAYVEGLTIAMKTGTAGDSRDGFDSVIMAFAPADKPRIAIGMIAENAGPAEFAGARIARDFFAAVR